MTEKITIRNKSGSQVYIDEIRTLGSGDSITIQTPLAVLKFCQSDVIKALLISDSVEVRRYVNNSLVATYTSANYADINYAHKDDVSVGGGVPTSRTVSTTAPLQGGGSLSSNLTLSISPAGVSSDGYMSSDHYNLLAGAIATDIAPDTLVIRGSNSGVYASGLYFGSNSAHYITETDSNVQNFFIAGSSSIESVSIQYAQIANGLQVYSNIYASADIYLSGGNIYAAGGTFQEMTSLTFKDDGLAAVINTGTSSGTRIGSGSQKISFWDTLPITQPSGSAQAAITNSTGGTASTTLSSITAGASYSQSDMTNVKNAIASLWNQLNAIRTALVNIGLIKGSA
jgi:hypothetical protein